MYTITLIVLVAIIIFIHEYGHLQAMLKYRVPVIEICVGWPVRCLTITIQKPWLFEGVPLRISLIILGGYLKVENENLNTLSTKSLLEIYGAGIIMNLVFICGTIIVVNPVSYVALIALITGVLLWSLKEWFCLILLPIIAFGMFVFLPIFLVEVSSLTFEGGQESSRVIESIFLKPDGFLLAVEVAGWFSLVLAVVNMLPLSTYDGGRIVSTCLNAWKWVPKKVVKHYEVITGIAALLTMVVLMYDTVAAVARLIWRSIFS